MRRFLSILALFALLFAPAGMLGSHSAMAMPHQPAASAGHCSEQQQHENGQEQAMIDCAIACTALPSNGPAALADHLVAAVAPDALPALVLDGTRPEAATPPPRFS